MNLLLLMGQVSSLSACLKHAIKEAQHIERKNNLQGTVQKIFLS